MSLQHWKLSLRKKGARFTLFGSTSDQMVAADLASTTPISLIRVARQFHRRPQTEEQDHRDLAIGAFMQYAADGPYNLDFEHIEMTPEVPDEKPAKYVGGTEPEGLVPIWEQRED